MKFKPPYILLIIVGVVLLLMSFFPNDRTTDIHFHDTIFIIALTQIHRCLGFLLLFFWALYTFLYKNLFSKILVWIHIITTVIFFIFLVIIPYLESLDLPRERNDAFHFFLNRTVVGFSIVCAVTQL